MAKGRKRDRERLLKAFDEWVDPGTFDGEEPCDCLVGQVAFHVNEGREPILIVETVADHFHLPRDLVNEIFIDAADYVTKEEAVEMAGIVLGLE